MILQSHQRKWCHTKRPFKMYTLHLLPGIHFTNTAIRLRYIFVDNPVLLIPLPKGSHLACQGPQKQGSGQEWLHGYKSFFSLFQIYAEFYLNFQALINSIALKQLLLHCLQLYKIRGSLDLPVKMATHQVFCSRQET